MVHVALPSASAAQSRCWEFHTYERRLAAATNATRSEAGLRTITLDPELSMAAREHSKDMAARGRPFHSDTDSLAPLLDGTWERMSENVGAGGSVTSMHEMFMGSRTHFDNIVARGWDHIGVGQVRRDGRNWITVLFQRGDDLGTTMRLRPC